MYDLRIKVIVSPHGYYIFRDLLTTEARPNTSLLKCNIEL